MGSVDELYQEEIQAYKLRIQQLEYQNESTRETNTELLQRLQKFANLTKMAKVANKDLHTAFEHVRDENLQIVARQDDQIISQELEEKEDIFQQKYINLVGQSVSWLNNKAELQQRIKFLEREIERYERDNKTLSKQVRHLIKTLEEERGMIIKSAREAENAPTCAADVIDSRLVTFESITDLQQNNQKLLSLVKEMSKREEEQEIQLESEEVAKLNDDIKGLRSEIQNVQNDREQMRNTLNTILKERDLFKILLTKTRQVEHMTPEIFQKMVSIACSSGPAISNTDDTHEKDAHVADLKSALSKVEQNLADLRDNFDRSKTAHNAELKLKDELLEKAHLKVITECQRADVLLERNKMLEENMSSLSTEFDEARVKVQRLTFELEESMREREKEADTLNTLSQALEREREARQTELAVALNQAFEGERDTRQAELTIALTHALGRERETRQADLTVALNQVLEAQREIRQSEINASLTHAFEREREIRQVELTNALNQALNGFQKPVIELDIDHHRDEIIELQRLRNLERNARLKVEREYFQLLSMKGKSIRSRIPTLTGVLKPKPETEELIEQVRRQSDVVGEVAERVKEQVDIEEEVTERVKEQVDIEEEVAEQVREQVDMVEEMAEQVREQVDIVEEVADVLEEVAEQIFEEPAEEPVEEPVEGTRQLDDGTKVFKLKRRKFD